MGNIYGFWPFQNASWKLAMSFTPAKKMMWDMLLEHVHNLAKMFNKCTTEEEKDDFMWINLQMVQYSFYELNYGVLF